MGVGAVEGESFSTIVSPGKSGSHFYFSPDTRYVIKTINDEEFQFFRDNVFSYYEVPRYPAPIRVCGGACACACACVWAGACVDMMNGSTWRATRTRCSPDSSRSILSEPRYSQQHARTTWHTTRHDQRHDARLSPIVRCD